MCREGAWFELTVEVTSVGRHTKATARFYDDKAISKSEMAFFYFMSTLQYKKFLEIELLLCYNDKLIVSDYEYLLISLRLYRIEHRRMYNALV